MPTRSSEKTLAEIGMPKEMVMRHRLPQFGHLFSSDAYSAGYYSYLWSETMDADTWAAFEEAGNPFDRTIADAFRTYLLSTGNETDRAEAYRAVPRPRSGRRRRCSSGAASRPTRPGVGAARFIASSFSRRLTVKPCSSTWRASGLAAR